MRAFALLPLFFVHLVPAQDPLPHSLLWRIQASGTSAASYLYGTVHSKDDRAFQFGDSVLPALDRCAIAAGELDLSADKELGKALFTTMRLPNGQKLVDLYKKKEWSRVEAAMKDELGFMAPMLSSLKPFFVLAILTENQMNAGGGEQTMVLDQYLQHRALNNGKRVIGIETAAEQIAAIDAVPLKVQATMLLDHVDNGGHPGAMDEMLNAYARQDLEALMAEGEKAGGMPAEFERALLTERNHRMVERMDTLLQKGEPVFFLIGAAHLPSPLGLIHGLRAKGYVVEAVMSVHTPPVLLEEPAIEER